MTWPSQPQLSGRCPEVAVGISPWIRRRSLARFHSLVFRDGGRGAHVEVVKGVI